MRTKKENKFMCMCMRIRGRVVHERKRAGGLAEGSDETKLPYDESVA
jgi:hypothetical protein